MNFWSSLIDTEGFIPRAVCGRWPPGLILLHNASDFFIWTAYLAIPVILVHFIYRRRRELPFRQVFWLFALFIISCGTTHFMDIVMFYYPMYRLAGLIKVVTAVASWATVIALIPIVPVALAMRSPEELQREIAVRKDAEQQVTQLNLELEDRVKVRTADLDAANRSKDEFLMTLSHELRTPINAIQGWASLLKSGQLDDSTQAEAINTIERSAWAQARLVDDILEVSRIITGKMLVEVRPCALRPLLEEALISILPAAKAKDIQVLTHLTSAPVLVNGDPERLRQVVWNLLSNAIKFTPPGGQVDLRLSLEGEIATVAVTDNGEGIDPEVVPFVFDRFRQADSTTTRRHGGLGLGLAIVRHLVELQGGTVEASSGGPGTGATFTVKLPQCAELPPAPKPTALPTAPSNPPAATHLAPVLQGLKILVVDDEPEARTLAATILKLAGAQVQTATSPDEAALPLAEWPPDLLISDIGMPGQSGLQFMRALRQSHNPSAQIPALALTAYAHERDRDQALQAGFNAYLSKPVTAETLVAAVQRLKNSTPAA